MFIESQFDNLILYQICCDILIEVDQSPGNILCLINLSVLAYVACQSEDQVIEYSTVIEFQSIQSAQLSQSNFIGVLHTHIKTHTDVLFALHIHKGLPSATGGHQDHQAGLSQVGVAGIVAALLKI